MEQNNKITPAINPNPNYKELQPFKILTTRYNENEQSMTEEVKHKLTTILS
jgi:hypothetical protein